LPVKIERKKVWTFVELFYEFKVARYTFLKIKDFVIWILISGELLFVEKQRVSDLYNTITKEFGIFLKVFLTAVAIATMTSQHDGYFMFKVI
jgi:hypothetical protein